MLARLSPDIRQYLLITGNYWAFTLTDGALRMLVVLHFHQLGYSPLQVALLFLFYEIFGVITNLVGGWLGARIGLNRTMNIGLAMQVIALSMLLVPAAWLTVPWVMAAQALSGIAKDLNKMSAKSSIKLLVPGDQQGTLFRWVAALTGSKNALKGIGFFLGGALLTTLGFATAVAVMAGALLLVCAVFAYLSPQAFATLDNAINVTRQIAFLVLIAVGATFVMAAGEFDLSVGAMASFAGVMAAQLAVSGMDVTAAVVL